MLSKDEFVDAFEALSPERRVKFARYAVINSRHALAAARRLRRHAAWLAANDPEKREKALALEAGAERMVATCELGVRISRSLVRETLRDLPRRPPALRRPVIAAVPRRRWACRPRAARGPPRRTDDDPDPPVASGAGR